MLMKVLLALFAVSGALSLGLIVAAAAPAPTREEQERIRQLYFKWRGGRELTRRERTFYRKKHKDTIADRMRTGKSLGLVPLPDLKKDGGLYGGGRNAPPKRLAAAAKKALAAIRPLDAQGNPSPAGRIALISAGMSNTSQEFLKFMQVADADPDRSPHLTLVNCAQGGRDAHSWADERSPGIEVVWEAVLDRIAEAGVTPAQVQVAWLKHALMDPGAIGPRPAHTDALKKYCAETARLLRKRLPNLKVIYLASRIYAGYATGPLNPEPYAYESAFAVRETVLDQLSGGEIRLPVLLWGPYLWADGVKGRNSDGLAWTRADFAKDGTHPSEKGQEKVARLLLDFFKKDPANRRWFTAD